MLAHMKRFGGPLLVVAIVALLLAAGLTAVPALADQPGAQGAGAAQSKGAEPQPIYNSDGTIDVGPVIRNKQLPLDLAGVRERIQATAAAQTGPYGVGDIRTFLVLDDYQGLYLIRDYEVRLISDTVEVWVQTDLNYYNPDGTLNPIHPDSQDPLYITQERIEQLAAATEDLILPTDVEYFGDYDSHDGSNAVLPGLLGLPDDYYVTDNGKRVIILVSNVRDGNFYDPVNNSSFIAGFYSPVFEFYADRNIITIDSKQWNRRVGAPDFTFDATIAHEFQHLINDDYDDDEDSWANEGRSELAEFLVGYRNTPTAHRTQWSDYPENSLTLWGDQDSDPDQTFEILADYQQAYWFFLYLAGRLDEAGIDDFLKAVAGTTMDPANGAESIDALLDDLGAPFDFEEVWTDFRTAMLYGGTSDGTDWGDYISAYSPPSGVPVAPLDLGRMRRNLNFEGYDTEGAPPDGSDYIEIGWSEAITSGTELVFDGDTTPLPSQWTVITAASTGITPTGGVSGNVLYSGHTDFSDNFLIFQTTVPTDNQELAFDTLYNIEEHWDFGFVQVTTDTANATGFQSLALAGMISDTDPSAHPIIVANVPGFGGVSGTDESDDEPNWVHVTYDLSAYAGQDILLAFRYSADWAASGNDVEAPDPGWYLDNITVGGNALYTDEATVADAGGMSIWEARNTANDFRLDIVTFEDGNGDAIANVYTTTLDANGDGTFPLGDLLNEPGFDEAGERVVALVSALPPPLDPDLISIPSVYSPYKLSGLPPSVYTSRARALGTANDSTIARPRVYPGDNITVTITVDNFGRVDDLEAVSPTQAYVAAPIPENTTFVPGSLSSDVEPGNFQYTNNLQTLDAGLPAVPGVYWHGTVTRTADLSFAVKVDAPLAVGTMITPTVEIANASFASDPSQRFSTIETPVQVVSPLALSNVQGPDEVFLNSTATFSYTLINTDDAPRTVDFYFEAPDGTSLQAVRVNREELGTAAATEGPVVNLENLEVPSYIETGEVLVIGIDVYVPFGFTGDTVSPTASISQPGLGTVDLSFAASPVAVTGRVYIPILYKNDE